MKRSQKHVIYALGGLSERGCANDRRVQRESAEDEASLSPYMTRPVSLKEGAQKTGVCKEKDRPRKRERELARDWGGKGARNRRAAAQGALLSRRNSRRHIYSNMLLLY